MFRSDFDTCYQCIVDAYTEASTKLDATSHALKQILTQLPPKLHPEVERVIAGLKEIHAELWQILLPTEEEYWAKVKEKLLLMKLGNNGASSGDGAFLLFVAYFAY